MSRARRSPERCIVIAVPDFEPTVGGTSRHARNLAVALQDRGHRVVVLTQRLDRSWPAAEWIAGVEVHRLGPASRRRGAMKLFVAAATCWFIGRRRSTTAVFTLMYPDLGVAAALAGLGGRTAVCWAGLGDATDTLAAHGVRAPLAWLRRMVLARSRHVALTHALSAELITCGVDPRSIDIIPTPVDSAVYRPPSAVERQAARAALDLGPTTFAVVYTGHLRRLKRVERLVEAAAALVDDGIDARLYLLGDSRGDLDDATPTVEAAIEATGLTGRTARPGAVADVRSYLWAADAFVLPSEREGLSNSLLEALACGVPCIAPPSAGGDQVLDDSCGVVPSDGGAAAIHAALLALASDPARRQELATGAVVRSARYSLAQVALEIERLIGRLDRVGEIRSGQGENNDRNGHVG